MGYQDTVIYPVYDRSCFTDWDALHNHPDFDSLKQFKHSNSFSHGNCKNFDILDKSEVDIQCKKICSRIKNNSFYMLNSQHGRSTHIFRDNLLDYFVPNTCLSCRRPIIFMMDPGKECESCGLKMHSRCIQQIQESNFANCVQIVNKMSKRTSQIIDSNEILEIEMFKKNGGKRYEDANRRTLKIVPESSVVVIQNFQKTTTIEFDEISHVLLKTRDSGYCIEIVRKNKKDVKFIAEKVIEIERWYQKINVLLSE